MHIKKKIRTMSFANLEDKIGSKVFTSLKEKEPLVNKFSSDIYFVFSLMAFLVLEAVMFVAKLYTKTKCCREVLEKRNLHNVWKWEEIFRWVCEVLQNDPDKVVAQKGLIFFMRGIKKIRINTIFFTIYCIYLTLWQIYYTF